MAGIYIHIPFCKKRCLYCDFYSETKIGKKESYISALCCELEMRATEIEAENIDTIYFGGGTPSQLTPEDFDPIFNTIYRVYSVSPNAEITLEANPDDLSTENIRNLRKLPFNRLSLGIQSFSDPDLHFLNRRHTAEQAIQVVEQCQENGYSNISIDLMYGLPGQTIRDWEDNLKKALKLNIQHISAYHLIYEEGTALCRLRNAGQIKESSEELSIALFETLIQELKGNGFVHYEISNFAKEGYFSRHNTSYWQNIPYLGIGASAHSYDRRCRKQNIADITAYIDNIGSGKTAYETEILDENSRYNDLILTSLRTCWGLDMQLVKTEFGEAREKYCLKQAAPYLKNKKLLLDNNILKVTNEGLFISDSIMSDLLYVD